MKKSVSRLLAVALVVGSASLVAGPAQAKSCGSGVTLYFSISAAPVLPTEIFCDFLDDTPGDVAQDSMYSVPPGSTSVYGVYFDFNHSDPNLFLAWSIGHGTTQLAGGSAPRVENPADEIGDAYYTYDTADVILSPTANYTTIYGNFGSGAHTAIYNNYAHA